jgi:hypothetical protein
MAKSKRELTLGDYPLSDQDLTAGARREFIKALGEVVPEVFSDLRNNIFPEYAILAGDIPPDPSVDLNNSDSLREYIRLSDEAYPYWKPGWSFDEWCVRSDEDKRLAPCLLQWSRRYHLEYDWILEGALQTLYLWHLFPHLREGMDLRGFDEFSAGLARVHPGQHTFHFEAFWDPQFQRWRDFSKRTQKRFQIELAKYEDRLRLIMEEHGIIRAPFRHSVEHFQWLALYQCAEWPLKRIQIKYKHTNHKTAISKGITRAAELVQVVKRGKLKNS